MVIDVAVFAILILAAFKGFRKGFIVAIFSFIGFMIGLAAALRLSAAAAEAISAHASLPQRWLPLISFVAVFALVVLLVRLGARLIETGIRLAMLGWANRLAGFFFYALIYLFVLSAFLFYAVQLHVLKSESVTASATYPYLQPLAPKMMQILSSVFPFLKDTFDALLRFFEQAPPPAS